MDRTPRDIRFVKRPLLVTRNPLLTIVMLENPLDCDARGWCPPPSRNLKWLIAIDLVKARSREIVVKRRAQFTYG